MTKFIGVVTGTADAQQFPERGQIGSVRFKCHPYATTYFLIGLSEEECIWPIGEDTGWFPAQYLSEFWYKLNTELYPNITGGYAWPYLYYWGEDDII